MNLIKSFFTISPIERRLFLEALLTVYWVKIKLIFISFKKMAEKYPSVKHDQEFDVEIVRTIRRAIIRANRLTFWGNKCLTNSFCARKMLNKRNIPSEAHLGIRKAGNDLAAHAWVSVSNIQVVPKEEEYTKVYQF